MNDPGCGFEPLPGRQSRAGDHPLGPTDGEEAVAFAPHQLDGNVDPPMQLLEIVDVLIVEAAQEPHGRLAVLARAVEGPEEELIELTVEQLT